MTGGKLAKLLVGASMSKPHIDEFGVEFLSIYIYRTLCCKSLPALISGVLASFIISKTSKKTRTIDGNSKDGVCGPTYS